MIPQLESSLAKLSESGMLSIVDNIQANPKILADITADNGNRYLVMYIDILWKKS